MELGRKFTVNLFLFGLWPILIPILWISLFLFCQMNEGKLVFFVGWIFGISLISFFLLFLIGLW